MSRRPTTCVSRGSPNAAPSTPLPRRRPGPLQQRGPAPVRGPRTHHPAHRAGHRDRAHRPDRHRLHVLQLPLQPGPQTRLPRSHQRWPRGLEHRDHGGRGGRPQLRSRRRARARHPLRARRRVPGRGAQALGQLGGRPRRRRQDGGSLGRPRQDPSRAAQGDVLQCGGRPQRAPHTAGSPASRAGGLLGERQTVRGPVRGSGVHRPADPRGRPGLLRRPQVPYRAGQAGTRTTSRFCRASSRSSARPRRRRAPTSGSWRTTSCTSTG